MNRGVGMLESGVSQRRVAGILNMSQSVVSRMWNRHLTHGNPSHRHGGGRDRATTERQDRFLLIQSRRQRSLNATRLNNEFRNGIRVRISTQTVRNRLHEFGQYQETRCTCPVDATACARPARLCQNSR